MTTSNETPGRQVPAIDLTPLLARCVRDPASGCLLWPGSLHAGYAVVRRQGKKIRLHRALVEREIGHDLPREVHVRHRCPDPARRNCLELTHLAPGSAADNVHDMVEAGRQARGERHGLHRLTVGNVQAARAARVAGFQYRRLASIFGVDPATVRRAVTGQTWG